MPFDRTPIVDRGIEPEGYDTGYSWPGGLPEYTLDQSLVEDGRSYEAFNRDLAVDEYGVDYLGLCWSGFQLGSSAQFKGDLVALCYLMGCIDLASAVDPDSEWDERFDSWDHSSNYNYSEGAWRIHLEGINLSYKNVSHITLFDARLDEADLKRSKFTDAFLSQSVFDSADMRYADFSRSEMDRCSFSFSILDEASLVDASLQWCDFTDASIWRADLSGADVRGAYGLMFNENPVVGLRIEGNAPDPWSQLRRKYTGPWFFVHAAFLVAFILPYVGNILALTAADRVARLIDGVAPIEERVHAVLILIGWADGAWSVLTGVLLLVFNALRLLVTMQVGMLRDAEERSGVTPALDEYMGTQGLAEESRWHSAGVALWMLAMYAFSAVRFAIEFGAWWILSRYGIAHDQERQTIAPRLRLEPIGYWRIHQLLHLMFGAVLLLIGLKAIDWIRFTTVPSL